MVVSDLYERACAYVEDQLCASYRERKQPQNSTTLLPGISDPSKGCFTQLRKNKIFYTFFYTIMSILYTIMYVSCQRCDSASQIMSSESSPTEYEESIDSTPLSGRPPSDTQLVSVLSAMQSSINQTNFFLQKMFNKQHTEPGKRSHAVISLDEGEMDEPASKKATYAPKSGPFLYGNDHSNLQQSSVNVPESGETGEANDDDDDAMSLFGGSEFDEVDNRRRRFPLDASKDSIMIVGHQCVRS